MSDFVCGRSSLPRLAQLPNDVKSAVRSGHTISCAAQAVEELVLNAIDAEATKILVGVNFDNFRIRIDDNGNGIQREDLEHIGTRYSTSKCHSLEDLNNIRSYGFRGEALASIIDISVGVELTSRSKLGEHCYTKKFTNGKQNGTIVKSHGSRRETNGLSIKLVNFMGKFPVRQNRIDHSIEIEEIKAVLERILLINPHVALEYRNDTTGAKILNISSSLSVTFAFRKIFVESTSGMASHENLMESHFAHGSFFFKIYVSKASHHNKNLQLVYVNKRHIARGKIHRALHQSLSKLFGFEGHKTGNKSRKEDKKRSSSSGFKSESRGLDEYPIFILNIECPPTLYDMTFEPKKTVVEFRNWNSLMEGVEGLKDRVKVSFKNVNTSIVVAKHSGKSKLDHNRSSEAVASTSKDGRRDSGNLEDVGKNITTHSMRRAVHSRVAVRGGVGEDQEVDKNSDGEQRTYGQSISRGSQHSSDDEAGEMSKNDDSSKFKELKNKQRFKLQLSTVSRKKTAHEMKNLKRKISFDDSNIHSKRHRVLATKSTRASAGLSVGLLKNISEKFSPWRPNRVGRGKDRSDKKKFIPWKGNAQKKIGDDVSDRLSRLNMSNFDTDSQIPYREKVRQWISGSREKERVKNKKCYPVPLKSPVLHKRMISSQESDSATENTVEDVDMSQNAKGKIEDQIETSQNKMDIPNSQSQSQRFVEDSDSSSESGDGDSTRLVKNQHCYNVILEQLEPMAVFLGIEDCDAFSMSRALRHRTAFYTAILSQGSESVPLETETGQSLSMFESSHFIPSMESRSAMEPNQYSLSYAKHSRTEHEAAEINPNVTVVAETPPPNVFRIWSPSKGLGVGVGVGKCLKGNVHPSDPTGPVVNYETSELIRRRLHPIESFPPSPTIKSEDEFKVDEERNLVNSGISLELVDVDGNLGKSLHLEKWVNSTKYQKRPKHAFSALVGENFVRDEPNRVFDTIQPPKNKNELLQSVIERSQSLSHPQTKKGNESNLCYLENVFQLPLVDPSPIGDCELAGPAVNAHPVRHPHVSNLHEFIPPLRPPPQPPSKRNRRLPAETVRDPDPHYFIARPSRISNAENSRDNSFSDYWERDQLGVLANTQSQDSTGGAIVPPSPQELTLTSIPPVGQGHDHVEKSLYFSPAIDMEVVDDHGDQEPEKDAEEPQQETSQYFQPDNRIDDPQDDICEEWTDWEFEISLDVMGQEWLHTTDEFGCLKYVNVCTGEKTVNIVQVTGTEKLTAAQAKLLNKTFRYNWLCRFFPKTSNKFWNPNEDGKISKTGNIELAHEGKTILGESIRSCINGDIEQMGHIASKWMEGHLEMERSKCGGNCNNLEDAEKEENASATEVRVCEYWERPSGPPEMPILNLQGPEVNFVMKKMDSCRFSKTDLNTVRVIAQLDRKFIVAIVEAETEVGDRKSYLVLFDQHAVHERIRLERNLDDSFHEVEPGLKRILAVTVTPPITLNFEDTECRIMLKYRDQMKNLGVELNLSDDGSINVVGVPKCFAEKIANETCGTRDATMKRLLFSLLREQVNHIMFTNGLIQIVPKTIFDILCSQACHGAIKFGHELTIEACQKLLEDLKGCKVPFQCAHGRPALVPLLDIKSLMENVNEMEIKMRDEDFGTGTKTENYKVDEVQEEEASKYFN